MWAWTLGHNDPLNTAERYIYYVRGSSCPSRSGLPYAFTEQGVAMLSSVLSGEQAVQVNIAELARRLDEMEARYDGQFQAVFDAIRLLMAEPEKPSKRFGFQP